MVFEAHGMSFPCTELLLFNYAKVNTVFHSMAPLRLTREFALERIHLLVISVERVSNIKHTLITT